VTAASASSLLYLLYLLHCSAAPLHHRRRLLRRPSSAAQFNNQACLPFRTHSTCIAKLSTSLGALRPHQPVVRDFTADEHNLHTPWHQR